MEAIQTGKFNSTEVLSSISDRIDNIPLSSAGTWAVTKVTLKKLLRQLLRKTGHDKKGAVK